MHSPNRPYSIQANKTEPPAVLTTTVITRPYLYFPNRDFASREIDFQRTTKFVHIFQIAVILQGVSCCSVALNMQCRKFFSLPFIIWARSVVMGKTAALRVEATGERNGNTSPPRATDAAAAPSALRVMNGAASDASTRVGTMRAAAADASLSTEAAAPLPAVAPRTGATVPGAAGRGLREGRVHMLAIGTTSCWCIASPRLAFLGVVAAQS